MVREKGSEKSASLSREVRAVIEADPYLRNPLAEGLINYSALARKISPTIERRLARKVKEESIVVAVKRFADEIAGKTQKMDYWNIFAQSTLSMQDDVSCALLNSNPNVVRAIENLLNNTDWHPGEVRIIIESPGRVAVVLRTGRMKSLLGNLGDEVVNLSENNALITMREPMEGKTTYGVIAEITGVLSKRGISVDLVSAAPDLHFLVEERDSEETYRALKEIIRTAKRMIDEKKTGK